MSWGTEECKQPDQTSRMDSSSSRKSGTSHETNFLRQTRKYPSCLALHSKTVEQHKRLKLRERSSEWFDTVKTDDAVLTKNNDLSLNKARKEDTDTRLQMNEMRLSRLRSLRSFSREQRQLSESSNDLNNMSCRKSNDLEIQPESPERKDSVTDFYEKTMMSFNEKLQNSNSFVMTESSGNEGSSSGQTDRESEYYSDDTYKNDCTQVKNELDDANFFFDDLPEQDEQPQCVMLEKLGNSNSQHRKARTIQTNDKPNDWHIFKVNDTITGPVITAEEDQSEWGIFEIEL